MQFLDLVLLRLLLWIGLPTLLLVIAVGPRRFWRGIRQGWRWLWQRRLDPEEVLTQVVRQHEKLVGSLRDVLARSEAAIADIDRHVEQSEESIKKLEVEARQLADRNDDLGARAALYKLNLERAAVDSFRKQRESQRAHIDDVRRHLYLVELQLRQYQVGRSILLSQLAEAKTVEQQANIAARFDPFNAVADWQRAEGMVQEKALNARAVERIQADLVELPLTNAAPTADPAAVDAQLAELKTRLGRIKAADGQGGA
jgi:phage shock protein A